MTNSQDSDELATAGPTQRTNPRRQFSSNIGLRRQQVSPTHGSTNEQRPETASIHTSRLDKLVNQTGATRSEHSARTSSQLVRTSLQSQRQKRLSRSNYSAGHTSNDPTSNVTGVGQTAPDSSKSELVQETSTGSEDGMSPAILINPDLHLLPVAKTPHARASFDFCGSSPFLHCVPTDIARH